MYHMSPFMSPFDKLITREQIDKIIWPGIIIPADSTKFFSAVVLSAKKDGNIRY